MHRARQLVFIGIAIILAILVFIPPLIGIGLQKFVGNQLFFSGLQNQNTISISDYHRGWFSSDVKFRVKITDPDLRQLLIKIGIKQENIPNNIELMMLGHIQHGPIFYLPIPNLSTIFGLAVMDRKLIIPKEQQTFFSSVGLNEHSLRSNLTYLSFIGKFLDYFELSNYYLPTAGGTNIRFQDLQGSIWHWPFSQRIKGKVSLFNFSIRDSSSSLLLPNTTFQFDVKKDVNGLWIGNQSLSLAEIIVGDSGNELFDLNGIKLNTNITEHSGLLNAEKKFTIEKFNSDYEPIGSFYLKMSINRLNAKAISDLVDAYQDIARNGELYESQLKQKMLLIIPRILNPGTSINLDRLDIITPEGQLQMNANLSWPRENFSVNNLDDLLQTANLKASVSIATSLTDQFISYIAKQIYIYQLETGDLERLVEMRDNIHTTRKQNLSEILYLTQTNQIEEQNAAELKKLINKKASKEDYFDKVKKLVFDRKISLETSYLLDWQYGFLSDQRNLMTQNLQHYQDELNRQLHANLNEYIKQGIVKQDNKNYSVSVIRENGVVKVNGHTLQ